ncbi:T9SS type A sorting domain-containing protein [Flavobacterium sedimenticola]|uniref:T9SS type A sorting domain-containing protein n=1 Tax=Flavobacterium sedimenticola TaxID=3043286 RepID=A0ABT6XQY8_9FLAO|nr:T9SS type A sorting domain-containing protein [Flavobacterium sedimenticola]MDI9257499.1 T9SS type A sorting domain-containing protein [Flavobacterium sedimenticola]
MKKLLLLLLPLFFVSQSGLAQDFENLQASPSGIVRCATTENEILLRSANPNRETVEQFENWMSQKIAERRNNPTSRSTNEVITIPVVVHVLSNGDLVGVNENLADARIFSQIQVLNQDFRRMLDTPGYNDSEFGADTEIEFCLAQQKPDGTATNGINRITVSQGSFDTRPEVETMKTTTQWDPLRYFNIWVVNFGGSINNLLGYAQFPSTSGLPGLNTNGGAANTDGVVISYTSFGSQAIANVGAYSSTYNRGRTTTHEMGHALGLRHIWGDGNGNYQTGVTDCSATDYCADTPPAGYLHYGCQTDVDTCFDDYVDMVENYMDYSDDTCMNIFTNDQKTRIMTVMNNSVRRVQLKTSNACSAPLSVNESDFNKAINIYPNPTSNFINYLITDTIAVNSIVISDISGKEVYRNNQVALPEPIDVSGLSSGVYFVTFKSNAATATKKFIKE